MPRRSLILHLRMALLAVLTLSLVATGWAHRAPEVPDEALAFMAATGATVADFCGDVGQDGRHADPLCQACQISGGADLPVLANLPQPLVVPAEVDSRSPRENRTVARVLDLSRAPQGPPVA
ncbi:MAG: hypothetical protein U1E58_03325 [Tabrizicola sp.]